jgi:hypothetical protein
MYELRLGIDIGRVIIGGGTEKGADTAFLSGDDQRALATPPVAGAVATITELVEAFSGRVWLVSKAGPRIQERTRRWLEARNFFAVTGVPKTHLRFCRERPQKADHARELLLTHFIDDRLDVLRALRGVVHQLVLFGPQRQPVTPAAWLESAPDWQAVRRLLLDAQGKVRQQVRA